MISYPKFSAHEADALGRSLLGEPEDWSRHVLVVYASMADEAEARRRAEKIPNGLAVVSGPKINGYIKENSLADVVFVNNDARRIVYDEVGLSEEFQPFDEYMERWTEVSGREFLGTP